MVGTIVRIIESAARKSTEEGIAKYETYFVKTNKFLKYKNGSFTLIMSLI